MSSYTAVVRCIECKKVLAEITAYRKTEPDTFIAQGGFCEEFALPSIYCQDCLNKEKNKGG